MTTQYLEEADQLAARIAVINHGKKIAEGTSRELKAATGSGFLHLTLVEHSRIDEAEQVLEEITGNKPQRSSEGAALSLMIDTPQNANRALAALIKADIELADFSMGAPSLDEVFFALTGQITEPQITDGEA
ncbi:ABC-type multidrug transport system ATPase subunit [Phyllobacterium ifriqiyense]|uniref:ABC-type multidrug transport system ATPase subunit n=1 Tax=Phyllobacterium ifriqiyense TaxID=314238 RepID=A0ABU0S516_9HYPH|nr:DUF4162 domain-containing protein [Phyllobacterium ifriqiyense]MDQ0995829.1 ABC-type multidrug transport system ATPase subunit [Phyllobacterium ifriqiyense]